MAGPRDIGKLYIERRDHDMYAMKIEHIALGVDELEKMRQSYTNYCNAGSGEKYTNHRKGFIAYF